MYHPQIYYPNSAKSILSVDESSINSTMIANKKISLDSTSFSHPGITMSSGQFVISAGEHLIMGAPTATLVPIGSTTQTEFVYQWYDVTNSQFIGAQGRHVIIYTHNVINKMRAPVASCYVNTAITLELRCVSLTGSGCNAWGSYPNQGHIGQSWVSVYTSL